MVLPLVASFPLSTAASPAAPPWLNHQLERFKGETHGAADLGFRNGVAFRQASIVHRKAHFAGLRREQCIAKSSPTNAGLFPHP